MKRQKNQKPANKKTVSQKPAPKPADVAQKTAELKPPLVDQLQSQEREGLNGSQIRRKLNRADIIQLQRLHGNGYVQRLLAQIGGTNEPVASNGLQRQGDAEEHASSPATGQAGSSSQVATGSNGRSASQANGQEQQGSNASQKQAAQPGNYAPGTEPTGSTEPGQNQQAAQPANLGPVGSNGTGPATQAGTGPEQQQEQGQTTNQESHEARHQQEDQGGNQSESQQQEQGEEKKKGDTSSPKEKPVNEEPVKTKGQVEQKGQTAPPERQNSGQAGQGPGVGGTTEAAGPATQNAGPGSQGGSPRSAQEDPDYQTTVSQVEQAAEQEKAHQPATDKAQEAQAAAQAPSSEIEARAQANQTQEMEQAEAPPFDAAGFKAQLVARLQALTPSTAEQAEQFKSSNKVGGLKAELKGKVEEEQKKSKGPMEQKVTEAPDTGAVPAKPVTPLAEFQAGPGATAPAAQQAAPKPRGQDEVEAPLQHDSRGLDEQMAEAKITEEQLERSNEPEFTGAIESKKDAQDKAKEAPPKYRQEEAEQISQAQSESTGMAEAKLGGMHGQREEVMSQVGGKQGQAKGADEEKRAQVAAHIQSIFQGTRSNVEQILGELDGRVNTIFNSGAEAAKQIFESHVDGSMRAFKEERYSGPVGALNWVKDKLLGMPSEVNAFYQQGREIYLSQMDAVIDNVVGEIGQALQEAREAIAAGRAEIDAYVAQLPADLQEVGQQAAQEIADSFNQLESQVSDAQNALINDLAELYNQHLAEVDARVDQMTSENRGLLQQAADAIRGVIDKIMLIKDRLLSILERAASAIKDILKDPIGFLNNLVTGVKQGFQQFFGNIATHLSQGLIKWLVDTLGDAGIDMPATLDLKGIFGMVTQVLGVTWDLVRERATALLGENIVSQLEQTFNIFVSLKNEGLAGVWDFVSGTLGNIKDLIFEPIQEFIANEVIQGGIQKIIGLLASPAQAFIKATEGIQSIVSLFIGQGQKMTSLVGAIFESIKAIGSGAVGQAAQFIEQALAKAIPTTIGFLARVLGLGNIADKVKEIIQRTRQPIERAIDFILTKATRVARKIGGALGMGEEGEVQ